MLQNAASAHLIVTFLLNSHPLASEIEFMGTVITRLNGPGS